MTSLSFADVSEFQSVDWATYGAHTPAVIVRAHNGFRADNHWAANLAGSRKYCAWRGFYQYLPASVDPATAAKAFRATVGPVQPGEVLILDLEEGTGDQRARRQAWYDAVGSDVTRWTYSGQYFASQHLPGVALDWVAAYSTVEPTVPHVLWQRSSSGSFPGVTGNGCDVNQYNGTLAQLQGLTATGGSMTISADDANAIAKAVWSADLISAPWSTDKTNMTWWPSSVFTNVGQWSLAGRNAAQNAVAIVTENQAEIRALKADVAALQASVQAVLDAVKAVAPAISLTDAQLAQVADAARAGAADTLNNSTIKIVPTTGGTTP